MPHTWDSISCNSYCRRKPDTLVRKALLGKGPLADSVLLYPYSLHFRQHSSALLTPLISSISFPASSDQFRLE